MKTLYLIDGSAFAYRAFYAMGGLTASWGQPTNAIYGFVRMLHKAIQEYNPAYLCIVFDKGKHTFRHKKYKDYKAQRKPMPDELRVQFPWIKKIISAYGISLAELDEYEADDIIASLSLQAESQGFSVYILTQDKDLLQMVTENINVIMSGKSDVVYTIEKVKERYGIRPEKIPELLALAGDTADNIQGVPGIGEKTASRLLQSYGSINGIVKSIDIISRPKIKAALAENVDVIRQNLGLTVLKGHIPPDMLDMKIKSYKRQPVQIGVLKDIFSRLEFEGMLNGLMNKNKKERVSIDIKEHSYVWNDVFQELSQCKAFSISLQSGNLGFSYKKNSTLKSLAVPISEIIRQDVEYLMANPDIAKYAYDIKAVYKAIMDRGMPVRDHIFDISIAEYLLKLAGTNLQGEGIGIQEKDSADIYKAVFHLKKNLAKEGLLDLFYKIEMPLINILAGMELHGIRLDISILNALSCELDKKLKFLTNKIYALAGESFNINSPKQLEYILFEKLNFPKGRRTKKGYSTDSDVLNALVKYHELPNYLLEYRKIKKLQSTYVDNLPRIAESNNGMLHTTFNQRGTATGRLSSSEPNLQNIPQGAEFGRTIRKAFIPSKDNWLFLGADYSQIELRILAHLSEDDRLVQAFKQGEDIHTVTAQEIFGVSKNSVSSGMRRQAKIVNFGIIYGMGAKSLAKMLGMPIRDAKSYIDAYYRRYPDVFVYIKDSLDKAVETGSVSTIFGRKRVIPELQSLRPQFQASGRRMAVNTPIQGSAADIIKLAMINIGRRIKKERISADMLLQIHDELIFETPPDAVDMLEKCVRQEMEGVYKLKVPLKVDIKIGKSLADI